MVVARIDAGQPDIESAHAVGRRMGSLASGWLTPLPGMAYSDLLRCASDALTTATVDETGKGQHRGAKAAPNGTRVP